MAWQCCKAMKIARNDDQDRRRSGQTKRAPGDRAKMRTRIDAEGTGAEGNTVMTGTTESDRSDAVDVVDVHREGVVSATGCEAKVERVLTNRSTDSAWAYPVCIFRSPRWGDDEMMTLPRVCHCRRCQGKRPIGAWSGEAVGRVMADV